MDEDKMEMTYPEMPTDEEYEQAIDEFLETPGSGFDTSQVIELLSKSDEDETSEEHDCLNEVLTGGEVASLYGLGRSVVMQAVRFHYIEGRHTGSVLLIRRKDAEARWGYRRKAAEEK